MENQNKKLVFFMLLGLIAAVALGLLLDHSSAPAKSSGDYQILITEICAKNESIIADNDGVFRDYIELFNAGPDVSLADFTLTDGQGECAPFGDAVLGTGEYRLVFLGTKITGFGLGASGGDCIQLKDPSGGIVTQTNVAAMTEDQVMIYQGGLYHTTHDASPGFPNDEAGLAAFRQGSVSEDPQILISEILAENVTACPDELGRYCDVVELHNISGQPVSLGGFWLSDTAEQRFRFRLPDVILEADGYLLIYCDSRNCTDENGMIHANFGLSAGDILCLTDRNGGCISADVVFAGENRSVALVPEGTFEPAAPSLGWPNTEDGIYSFSLREGETLSLTTPEYKISSPVTCVPAAPGMGISLQTEGYTFAAPSLGYANDAQGQESYAAAIRPDDLRISELMTGNRSYLLGPYGVGCDWVEFYNPSDNPRSLADYCLSDDPLDSKRCPLPDITLKPGEYCVILLANKPDHLLKGYSWIPMTLSSEGEGLYLSHGGTITDYAVIPALVSDISYGCPQDGSAFSTLASVTPGKPNSQTAEPAPMPQAVTAQGVYEDVEYLDVELLGEGEIYYTTDCTTPGTNATLYTGPIRLTETTVIRAVCRQSGMIQSQVLDLTYLINEKDNLPAVALVLEPDDLWSEDHGIYAMGYHAKAAYPHIGANFFQRWEKSASVSLFEQDGSGFTSPCGLRMAMRKPPWTSGCANVSSRRVMIPILLECPRRTCSSTSVVP